MSAVQLPTPLKKLTKQATFVLQDANDESIDSQAVGAVGTASSSFNSKSSMSSKRYVDRRKKMSKSGVYSY
jgi:hypothetical protein